MPKVAGIHPVRETDLGVATSNPARRALWIEDLRSPVTPARWPLPALTFN
jgi:hypothetical protein